MPIVIAEESFYDFVCKRLEALYAQVPNIVACVASAELSDPAFRVEVAKAGGRLTKFYPEMKDGDRKPFAVAVMTSEPGTTIVNLTAYGEVPAFIQSLIDEYAQDHPEHVISIKLK